MLAETPYLFVYGSLLSGARGVMGAAQRARLRAEGKKLGAATLCGRLIDLGSYPGVVLSQDANEVVHGEVYRLRSFQRSLAWLDVYEGLSQPSSASGIYRRRLVRVDVGDTLQTLEAWAYVLTSQKGEMRSIRHGRWLDVEKSRFSLRK